MNYVIFGRLLRCTLSLDSVTQGHKLSFLNPRRVSAIFLGSDIVSFLIQAGGSGLASSNDTSTSNVGIDILLSGMCLNFVSFTLFISLVVYFDSKSRKAYNGTGLERRFQPVLWALYTSWSFIMVCPLVHCGLIMLDSFGFSNCRVRDRLERSD